MRLATSKLNHIKAICVTENLQIVTQLHLKAVESSFVLHDATTPYTFKPSYEQDSTRRVHIRSQKLVWDMFTLLSMASKIKRSMVQQ